MKRASIIVLSLAAIGLGASCATEELPIEFETIEHDCGKKCMIAIYECGDSPTAEEQAACVEDCLDDAEASLEQGNSCAQSFETMMSCVGTLETCDEVTAWALRAADGACAEVSYAFDMKCEDLT